MNGTALQNEFIVTASWRDSLQLRGINSRSDCVVLNPVLDH